MQKIALNSLKENRPLKERGLELIGKMRKFDAIGAVQIVESGGIFKARDKDGMTALHHAAAMGSRGIVRALVTNGNCDFLAADRYGRLPYELAFETARSASLGRLLLKKTAQEADRRGVPFPLPPSHAKTAKGVC